jgi:hypothetical protein
MKPTQIRLLRRNAVHVLCGSHRSALFISVSGGCSVPGFLNTYSGKYPVKVKVFPAPNQALHHEDIRGSGDVAKYILSRVLVTCRRGFGWRIDLLDTHKS